MIVKKYKIYRTIGITVGSIILVAGLLAPLVWLLISSVADLKDLLKIPLQWIPENISFERYSKILFSQGSESEFRKTMMNSFVVASAVTIICVSIGSLSAYAFHDSDFLGKIKFYLYFSFHTCFLQWPSLSLFIKYLVDIICSIRKQL